VTVLTTLADDLPPVSGNRVELLQVLLNLVANAIDSTEHLDKDARRITISSSRLDAGSVAVAVKDSGVGLGDVDLDRMFTLSYTTKAAGTGVGLSVSRAIVEAHGGRIWAAPNPDRGATFSFSIPLHTVRKATPADSEPVAAGN
jgi:signal transduction histidine kinase